MILDIIILALIVIGAFFGYKKGLIGILFSVIGMIAAIVLALILQTSVAKSLYSTSIGQGINTTIKDQINNLVKENLNNSDSAEEEKIDFYGILIDKVANEEEIQKVSDDVTMTILKGLSFVLIFFIVTLISYILQMILNVVFNLPILNSVNNIGGVIFGILKMLVKIYIVLAIIYFVSTVPFTKMVTDMIDSSMLTKFLYNNNIFVNIIVGGLK